MSTSDGHNVIKNIDVLYSFYTSDHIPIHIDISMELNKSAGINLVMAVLMVIW